MVNYCCVYACKNNATMENVRFHQFPRDSNLAKQWEIRLKMGKPRSKTMVVCSGHFDGSDYRATVPSKRLKAKPFLKRLAVPTKNLPVRSFDRRPLHNNKRNERYQKRNQNPPSNLLPSISEPEINCNISIERPELEGTPEKTEDDFECNQPERISEDCSKESLQKFDKAIMVNTLEGHTCVITASSVLNDSAIISLTGLHSITLFHKIVDLVQQYFPSRIVMSVSDRVFLTLMKLKLGISFSAVGALFGTSRIVAANHFKLTLTQLDSVLECAVVWLEKEQVVKCLPQCFEEFQNTRVVLDCTEVEVEKPACLQCKIKTYSHYKGRNTCKILVGIAPSGVITYVSKAYAGKCSDKQLTEESGILEKCYPYVDALMVDKGFAIEDLCNEKGLELIRPPFLKKKIQFTKTEALRSAKIAAARVHVERAIGRMRAFNCLNVKLPFELLPYANSMLIVISAIVNLSPPILANDKF